MLLAIFFFLVFKNDMLLDFVLMCSSDKKRERSSEETTKRNVWNGSKMAESQAGDGRRGRKVDHGKRNGIE